MSLRLIPMMSTLINDYVSILLGHKSHILGNYEPREHQLN